MVMSLQGGGSRLEPWEWGGKQRLCQVFVLVALSHPLEAQITRSLGPCLLEPACPVLPYTAFRFEQTALAALRCTYTLGF